MSETFGAITGLIGFTLVAVGVLLALFAGIRMLWVIRRPGKGRIARGIAVGGLVLALCGALLFTIEDRQLSFRAASDRIWQWLAGLSVLIAVLVGARAGRRRPARKGVEPDATKEEVPGPEASQDAAPTNAESREA